MRLPLQLLLLFLCVGQSPGRRCGEADTRSGSPPYGVGFAHGKPHKTFQWKYILGKDIRRTQSSTTRLNFQRAVDGFAESVHAIPPMPDREISEDDQQEQAFGGRRAHGVKTVEYNQDPVDSFERAIAGDEFDDRPPLDPVNVKDENVDDGEDDITMKDPNLAAVAAKRMMTPVPAAIQRMTTAPVWNPLPVGSTERVWNLPTQPSTLTVTRSVPTQPTLAPITQTQPPPPPPTLPSFTEPPTTTTLSPLPPAPIDQSPQLANPPAPLLPLPSEMGMLPGQPEAVMMPMRVVTAAPVPPQTIPTLASSKMEKILARVVVMDNLPQVIRYPPKNFEVQHPTLPWWMKTPPVTPFNPTTSPAFTFTTAWWMTTTQPVTTTTQWIPTSTPPTRPWWGTTTTTAAPSWTRPAVPIPSTTLAPVVGNQIVWQPQQQLVNTTRLPVTSTTWDGEAEVLEETELRERKLKDEQAASRKRSDNNEELITDVDSSEEAGTEEEYVDGEKEKITESRSLEPEGPTDATLEKARNFLKNRGTAPRKGSRKPTGDEANEEEVSDDPDALPKRKGKGKKKADDEECCNDEESQKPSRNRHQGGKKSKPQGFKEESGSHPVRPSKKKPIITKPAESTSGAEDDESLADAEETERKPSSSRSRKPPREEGEESGSRRTGGVHKPRGGGTLSSGGARLSGGGGRGTGGGGGRGDGGTSRGGGRGGGSEDGGRGGSRSRGGPLGGGSSRSKPGGRKGESRGEEEAEGNEDVDGEDFSEFEETTTPAEVDDSNIRTSMHQAALKDAKTAKYYYPPKTTIPLPTCFHNPSGYVCCNLKLNNVIEEAYQMLKTSEEFNPCNIGKMARTIQKVSQDTFGHPFESIVALSDFAQNVHFAGDMVCKLEIDGKFMLSYATPYNADEVESVEEEGGGAVFEAAAKSRKIRRSLPIHTFRM